MVRLVVAGLIALGLSVGVTTLKARFTVDQKYQDYGVNETAEFEAEVLAAHVSANQKNMGIWGGLIGAIICSFLAAGTIPGSFGRITTGFVTGAGVGALFGALGGAASVTVLAWTRTRSIDPFVDTVLAQGCFTIAIGAGLGLTLWLTAARFLSGAAPVSTIAAAAIASVIYPFIAAMVFPLLNSASFVPDGMANRALWLGLPIALCVLAIVRSRHSGSSDEAFANEAVATAGD